MAKISALPLKANPDGTETVVILDAGVAKRVGIGPLVSAAIASVIDAATAGLNAILASASGARDLSRAYAIAEVDAPIEGAFTPTDRSAKFWHDRTAENYGQLPGTYADLVSAQLVTQTTLLTYIASHGA